MKGFFVVLAVLLLSGATAGAERLVGKVIGASGREAEIRLESIQLPSVGDPVTIYFKLPGADDEVLVGTGKVISVAGDVVKAAIDDLKGTLQKEQLVRIDSEKGQPKSSTLPVTSTTPTPSSGPILETAVRYPCDDDSGLTLTETSSGRPMKLHGGLGFTAGKTGRALNFRDSAKLFATREKDDPVLNFADRDFTIELYANFHAFAHEQVLLEKFSGKAGPGWTLTVLDKAKLHFFTEGAGAFTAAVNLKPNHWYRLAIQRRGSRLQIFVDDTVALDQPMNGAIVASTNPLLLGRRNEQDGRAFPVNGLIDEIRIDVAPGKRD